MCMSSNAGGVMGKNDLASTFMWAKLKNNKVPTNYATAGLKPNQFVASNDLYGSFCRVRVNVQSDHKDIQDAINKGADWATAYFAAGDAFTCGSWITGKDLEKIAEIVGRDARDDQKKTQAKNLEWWLAPIAAIGTGVGGAYLGSGIANGEVFGKLSGLNSNMRGKKTPEQLRKACDSAINGIKGRTSDDLSNSVRYALNAALDAGVSPSDISKVRDAFSDFGDTISSLDKDGNDDKWRAFDTALNDLSTKCHEVTTAENVTADAKKTKVAAGVTGAVTAVAGGVLTYYATKAIQDAELDKAEREAYDMFMEEIGNHIYCYIGGEEAGQYGDVITTSME